MRRIVVRHSELKDARQCPLKHRLRWVEGWQAPDESDKQKLGTAWHRVLQAHYEQILVQQKQLGYRRWFEIVENEADSAEAERLFDDIEIAATNQLDDALISMDLPEQDGDTLRWMYEGYVQCYDLDQRWEVLLIESEQVVPFIEPSGRKSRRFAYQWHADLVVKDHSMGGRVVVVDHKSTAQPLGQHDVDLDDQFGLYTWALTQKGHDVLAPICSQAKTQRLKREMTLEERFTRILSHRTAVEQHNIAQDALRTARAMYSKANLDFPYSSPNPRTCGWSCEFKEVHMMIRKSPQGLNAAPVALIARGFTKEDRPDE